MTIFLRALKDLIDNELSVLFVGLLTKSNNILHDRILAVKQLEEIRELKNTIAVYPGLARNQSKEEAATDLVNVGYIIDCMEKKKASIVAIRKDHGKRSNEGNTLETLNNLILRIRGFYERLTTLKTKLWDRSDLHNAESLVYSRAVYYFGLELFSPITTTDESVRAEKEQKLDLALWRLSVLFANPYQEDYKREQIVHEMESLLNELRLPKADSVGIPGMSFLGGLVQFTTPEGLLSPGLGRLGDQLSWIIGKLQASVTVSSKELASVSSSITTTLKVPEVDSNLSLLGHLSFFPPISSAPQITIIDDNYDSATKSIAEGAVSKAG